jgi:DNA polymerase III gamma/tau subunit
MSLYHEYRPATFSDVMGNEETIEAMKAHFSQDPKKVSHCHIISGPSGCGKTTLARIIATELLGAHPQFSIKEINFAENRGIDTAREVIDQMRGFPLKGKSLVYILDEAHGMTNDAKTAFLKPTEEYPPHVYFFFCTTDLDLFLKGDAGKALGTRSTKWKVEPLSGRQLGALVAEVAEKEGFSLDDDVLSTIVDISEGSARDALTYLGQAMSAPTPEAQKKLILSAMPGKDPDTMELCRALVANKPWKEVSAILKRMKGKVDAEKARRAVLGYMSTVLLNKADKRIATVMDQFSINTYDTGFPGLVLAAWHSAE